MNSLHSIDEIEQVLSSLTSKRVVIELNRNERSLIRIAHRSSDGVHLSLHRLFLKAPLGILRALARFLKGDRSARLLLTHFIHICKDSSNAICTKNLQIAGEHHALDVYYRRMSDRYLPRADPLAVTWYAQSRPRAARSITLGLFDRQRQLIKVHRLLDRAEVPSLYIEFVLYHEALHNIFLPMIDERRENLRLHTLSFKRAERAFEGYRECRLWQRTYLFAMLERANRGA